MSQSKAAALLAAIAERKKTASNAEIQSLPKDTYIFSDTDYDIVTSHYEEILRNPNLVVYNKEVFIAFWKWRLLHPFISQIEFETVLNCMSANPPLDNFVKGNAIRFLHFFPLFSLPSLVEIQKLITMLNNMELTVPLDIQQELITFLIGHKTRAIEESQARAGGGLTGRTGFVNMNILADKASLPESGA
jgi:hypothetical protein